MELFGQKFELKALLATLFRKVEKHSGSNFKGLRKLENSG